MVGRTRNREIKQEVQRPKIGKTRYITVREYFLKYLFPDAILYGMSYNEFWNKDPQLFFSYRFSYMKRKETEREENNFNAWLQGAYNLKAYQVAIYNAFGDGKEKVNYFQKPIDFFSEPETIIDKEVKETVKKNNWARLKERRK